MQANNWLIRHRFGVRVKFARPARETVCGWDEFAYEKWTNLTVIEMWRGNTLGTGQVSLTKGLRDVRWYLFITP